jgi:hypothetical protein
MQRLEVSGAVDIYIYNIYMSLVGKGLIPCPYPLQLLLLLLLLFFIFKPQFCWHPVAALQYRFTHKQYTEYSNTVHTIQQYSTHLHTNSTHNTAVQYTFKLKQYTQYSSTSHIYTQTVHTIRQYSTHLHTNSTHNTTVQYTFTHKQYTQYNSTAHIYTQYRERNLYNNKNT